MDWIKISRREPMQHEKVWASIKGRTVLGHAYKFGSKWRVIFDGGNYILTKWATYDVEY